MSQIRAIVLRAAGINCDLETQNTFEMAGAAADRVHINRIIEDKSLLDGYQILVVPGGFSYGDDVAAGKILANQIKHHLYEQVRKFIDADTVCIIWSASKAIKGQATYPAIGMNRRDRNAIYDVKAAAIISVRSIFGSTNTTPAPE